MDLDREGTLERLRAMVATVPVRDSGAAGTSNEFALVRSVEDGPAREVCLTLLTSRARSRHELAVALARKGYGPEVVARVLDRLADSGLVDDTAFAQAWVAQRQHRRALSRSELGRELQVKGIEPPEQAVALAAVTEETEEAAARALLLRRLPAMARLPRAVAVRRMLGLLARRGFPPGMAGRLVEEVLAVTEADLDPSP